MIYEVYTEYCFYYDVCILRWSSVAILYFFKSIILFCEKFAKYTFFVLFVWKIVFLYFFFTRRAEIDATDVDNKGLYCVTLHFSSNYFSARCLAFSKIFMTPKVVVCWGQFLSIYDDIDTASWVSCHLPQVKHLYSSLSWQTTLLITGEYHAKRYLVLYLNH